MLVFFTGHAVDHAPDGFRDERKVSECRRGASEVVLVAVPIHVVHMIKKACLDQRFIRSHFTRLIWQWVAVVRVKVGSKPVYLPHRRVGTRLHGVKIYTWD